MVFEEGEIKVFNPSKEISREITLEILIRHRDALKQARVGQIPGIEIEQLGDNQRKINQVRALNLIISAQREMITISRPIIFFSSMKKWKKEYKTEPEQKDNPFEEYKSDYKKLKEWLDFLGHCQQEIIGAEKSQTLADDFLIIRQSVDGEIYELTANFFDMLADLEESYEQIYLLMLTNKIVSAGIEEDEEMEYKEKEREAIRRVVEA